MGRGPDAGGSRFQVMTLAETPPGERQPRDIDYYPLGASRTAADMSCLRMLRLIAAAAQGEWLAMSLNRTDRRSASPALAESALSCAQRGVQREDARGLLARARDLCLLAERGDKISQKSTSSAAMSSADVW